jgi:uncharacterized protein YxjI
MNITKCPKCGMTQMQRETCRACGKPLAAPAPPPPRPAPAARPAVPPAARPDAPVGPRQVDQGATATALDPAFDRDIFLLRQPILAINEKYEVWDESGTPIMFIERPAHLGRNLLATVAGFSVGVTPLIVAIVIATSFQLTDLSLFMIVLSAVLAGGFGGLALGNYLFKKRHVTFYRDATKAERLLSIQQDRKVTSFIETFTIQDAHGSTVARVRKNWAWDILRKRWRVSRADGSLLFEAREDLWHAIVSRLVAKLFPMNFQFHAAGFAGALGSFNRKLTIRDRYVLDLSPDRGRVIDRRLGLALGVLLDTGERR